MSGRRSRRCPNSLGTSGRPTCAVQLTAAPMVRLVDRKSTRLNSSHANISYAVFCLKKKKKHTKIVIFSITAIHLHYTLIKFDESTANNYSNHYTSAQISSYFSQVLTNTLPVLPTIL